MANNLVLHTDPNGDILPAILIGAAIGAALRVATNGIGNAMNGQGFFEGAGRAAIFGGISGALSFGIGNVATDMLANGVSKLGVAAFQTGAHGFTGGVMSVAQGGSFASGALSGALSSGVSSGAAALDIGNAGMIGIGGVMGGVGAEIGGGNFIDGFRQGLIMSGLNHAAHSGAFGEGVAMSLVTGQTRHIWKADAYAITIDGNAGLVGVETGGVQIASGSDKGKILPLTEIGQGAEYEASLGVVGTRFYFDGKASIFRASMLSGNSWQGEISIPVVDFSFSRSTPVNTAGNRVYGVGWGLSLPNPIDWGGYIHYRGTTLKNPVDALSPIPRS